MSVTPFQGRVNANLRIGRVKQVNFATAGFYFNHATEGGVFVARTPGKYEFKTSDIKGYNDVPWHNATDFMCELPLLQTSFACWNDIHLLSKYPHNLQIVTAEDEYLNMVPTTNNDYVSPNGSEMVGMNYKYLISDKARTLTGTWKNQILGSQEEWVYTNMGVASAGGSGGIALGLTAFTNDPTQFVNSNFAYVLVDGNEMGILDQGISLEFDSVGFVGHVQQPYSQMLKCKATVIIQQSASADLLAGVQNGRLNKTVNFYTRFNEQINFVGGSVRPGRVFGGEDKEGGRKQTFTFEGTIPYSQVTINAGSKLATFNLL